MSLTLPEIGHMAIVFAYFALAGASLLIRLPRRTETVMAMVGGFLFFTGCGLTHIDILAHIMTGAPLSPFGARHIIPTLMQVVGAPMFCIAMVGYARELFGLLRRHEFRYRRRNIGPPRGQPDRRDRRGKRDW